MKNIKSLVFLAVIASFSVACNPLEDDSLRDKFIVNEGTPITKAALSAAISVTQPFSNEDGVVMGDQCVVIKNKRPDIGGAWHIGWGIGEKILNTDQDTLYYEANGKFKIYYVGISENRIVNSDTTEVTVTNVFDPWSGFLTGAVDKSNTTASMTWGFREVSWGSVCNMGAHGGWKYTSAGYTPESNFAWWGSVNYAQAGDQTMKFEYNGSKMTTFKADGSVKSSGTFGFIHNVPEAGVLGTLVTTTPTIGASYDDCGQGSNNKFYLLTLTKDYITVYHNGWDGSADWGDCGWYAYFKAKK